MMQRAARVSLLDVTLRDGSYAIQYQFTPSHVARIIESLHGAGIDLIELGHGCGLGARENLGIGAAASDVEYVRAARTAAPGARLGVIAGPFPVTYTKDIDAVLESLDFIRFAANCDKPRAVEANLTYARRRKPNLLIFFQMMRSTRLKPEALLKSARQVQEMGADAVYIVDTAGHFIPEEVREIVALFTAELTIGVGFHGHNNLSLAVANTIAAVDAGAHYIDASLKGMGRAAGNAMLEAVISLLKRRGMFPAVNLDALIEAGEKLIAPLMPSRKGVDAIDVITADANVDLYPLEGYRQMADSLGLEFVEFVRMLGADPKLVEAGQMDVNRVLLRNSDRLKSRRPIPVEESEVYCTGDASSAERASVMLTFKGALSPGDCPGHFISALSEEFPGLSFCCAPYHPEKIPGLEDAEVLFAHALTPALLSSAKRLRWFHSLLIGVEYLDFSEITRRDITVTTPRGAHSVPVAESALCLMLALSRKLKKCLVMQEKRKWGTADMIHAKPPVGELSGAAVTVVGLGGIGTEIARRCASLDMTVNAVVSSRKEKPSFVERLFTADSLDEALEMADFVVLACPLTVSTKGLINRERIAHMKAGAYLINIARGPVIDEGALLDALMAGHIAGAGLDVFQSEPLPASHPFYGLDQVIMTPHMAGWSTHYWQRSMERFKGNLTRYLKKEPLEGVIDAERGY
jgi:4-hydroxy-2-oxovalerate aldolase